VATEPVSSTAHDIVKVLDRHYHGPTGGKDTDSYATWRELTEPGGRRIDYLALALWASRGQTIDGHEIKVSRSDWLSELGKPSKAEAWWPVCHRWWLVVPHESIVQEGELPDGWGLMVPPAGNRRAMKVVVKPTYRDVTVPSWLTIAMVKRDRLVHFNQLNGAVNRARHEARNEGRQSAYAEQQRREGKILTPDMEARLLLLARIEAELGKSIEQYFWRDDQKLEPEIAAVAIQVANALGASKSYGQLNTQIDSMLREIERASKAAIDLRKARASLGKLLTQEVAA
jgi:hypothetical protein